MPTCPRRLFIQLVRRDIVAQAVSLEKAEQTPACMVRGQASRASRKRWHTTVTGIARGLRRTVATGGAACALYADLPGRPLSDGGL